MIQSSVPQESQMKIATASGWPKKKMVPLPAVGNG